MKKFAVLLLSCFLPLLLSAQITLEEVKVDPCLSANRLRAYPVQEITPQTKTPKGYKPFYAYYIGRHGSRFQIYYDKDYRCVLDVFEKASADSALTAKGADVLRRLRVIVADADGRTGTLTWSGRSQIHGISERMYSNYPEIFGKDGLRVEAISTTSGRVIKTMGAWCEKMQELNPGASITQTPGSPIYGEWGSDTPGIKTCKDADTPFAGRLREARKTYLQPDRMMGELFTDPAYPGSAGMSGAALMEKLYGIASIIQSVDLEFRNYSLYDIFTSEELFNLAMLNNYEVYVNYGSSPETAEVINHMVHKPMELMIERAESAWKDGTSDAFLVFCHDGNIGPYAAALKIPWAYSDTAVTPEDAAAVYSCGRVVPMAANLQFIFYKNRKGKVLVKVLLNEREAVLPVCGDGSPYCDWESFKEFALSR